MDLSNEHTTNYKLVLNFDLDETLFELNNNIGGQSKLSKSAEIDLSKSVEGVLHNQAMITKENFGEVKIAQVSAIARKEYTELFKKIAEINKLLPGSIIVNIITRSNYTKNNIDEIFSKFFGHVDITLYRNIHDLEPNYRTRLEKRDLILRDTQNYYPGIKRNKICLIDDSKAHCQLTQDYGFTAIHMPTNPATRSGKKYSDFKESNFKQLHSLVDEVFTFVRAELGDVPLQ